MMEMISRKEAAAMLGVSPHTLDAMLAKGLIPFYRVGARMIRIDRADVERYLASVRVERRAAAPHQPAKPAASPRGEARGGAGKTINRPCLYVPGMKVV